MTGVQTCALPICFPVTIGGGGGGTPAGSDTQIQYNNAGAFGADAGFTRTSTGVTNILSTFGTDTCGYQISDNFFGAGFKGSANIWTNIAGDLGLTGILNIYQPQIIDQLTFAGGGGTITSYQWAKIAGSTVTIAAPNSQNTGVSNMVQSIYQFEIKVTASTGLVAKDTITVTVLPAANMPPLTQVQIKQLPYQQTLHYQVAAQTLMELL